MSRGVTGAEEVLDAEVVEVRGSSSPELSSSGLALIRFLPSLGMIALI